MILLISRVMQPRTRTLEHHQESLTVSITGAGAKIRHFSRVELQQDPKKIRRDISKLRDRVKALEENMDG